MAHPQELEDKPPEGGTASPEPSRETNWDLIIDRTVRLLPPIAEFLKSFAWPVATVFLFICFRAEISGLTTRISGMKVLGQEVQLHPKLDELQRTTNALQAEAAANTSPASDSFRASVLAEAARSPKAALMLLGAEIERRLRPFLAATGFHHQVKSNAPLPDAVDAITTTWHLSTNFRQSVRLFWDVREKIIHGYNVSDDDVLRAIDSGLLIMNALDGLPREKKVVVSTGVELFADAEGKKPRKGVWGLILENTSSDGKGTRSLQIFPTTRTHYRIGDEVTWDFDTASTYDETWYRDPRTRAIKHAFQQSMAFVGRSLKDVNVAPPD
jgi:hypothetical protein